VGRSGTRMAAFVRDLTALLDTPAGAGLVLDRDLFVRQAFTGGVLTPVADLEPDPREPPADPGLGAPASCSVCPPPNR
jgi:hypothetical protein